MRVLRWAGRFWTGILIIIVLLAAHVCGDALPHYAPAFLLARYEVPEYRKLVAVWGDEGQL